VPFILIIFLSKRLEEFTLVLDLEGEEINPILEEASDESFRASTLDKVLIRMRPLYQKFTL
jgi:hypothetical protein